MRTIEVMGIANVTPDSFYASSRCQNESALAERVGKMLDEGADIIDIGACSTRPGSEPCGAEEEWDRLEWAIRLIHREFPEAKISIDSFRSDIVRRAFDVVGDFIANDVSAAADPDMLPTVASLGLTYISTHTSREAHDNSPDIVGEVREFFRSFEQRAEEAGVRDWIADPGFGFGKSIDENYELLAGLDRLGVKRRILIGVSRKSMIYKPFGLTPEDCLPQTQVLHLAALQRGADILRVHDVAEAVRTVETYRRLNNNL